MATATIAKRLCRTCCRMSCKQCIGLILACPLMAIIVCLASQMWRDDLIQSAAIKRLLVTAAKSNATAGSDAAMVRPRCSLLTAGATPPAMGKVIPKIFHQTYKTSQLPSTFRPYIAKCRELNPDWQYFLWRDEDIVAFIAEFFPQYMRKYRVFTMNVQRADFIRYMVLYVYGGVYLDMDVECVKPFFPDLERHPAFLDQERKEHSRILYQREFVAMNSAMGSVRGHPFYLRMLESINSAPDSLQGAGITTGPDRLTIVYEEWVRQPACMGAFPVTLLDPEIFSPLADVKLHNFHDRCRNKELANNRWFKAGCELIKAKDWKADVTNSRTVGRHLFLHMGYSWGPRASGSFEAEDLGPVRVFKADA